MFKTIIFNIAFVSAFAAFAPFFLVALPSRRLTQRLLQTLALCVLWLARVIGGIKYKIHNNPFCALPSTLGSAGNIVASKHMSTMETAVLMAYVPNAFFIIKRELTWIPIYGWVMARLGMLAVNRKAGSTNMQALARAVAENIERGMTLVIFPEGTRARPGQQVKLRRGLLYIAEQLKLPILPVGTDSGIYWPKHGRMKSGTANFWFEPALPQNASLDEIAAAIGRHSA
ncbi:MAG: 1-acyl-sn-glycerol-3-phosphate acyltransferase [Rickettsiales bacterium]|jgi:1-acyl-sn-glycerol-3-phosphate acyltransferase|nr:1-acyl-sn-glycerol-3-phosphate acyltransferase [Rickettsiales bacterium]